MTTSLLLSLATFGAGFLMRPLGALVLGASKLQVNHDRNAGQISTDHVEFPNDIADLLCP